jgi:hypothetical protein
MLAYFASGDYLWWVLISRELLFRRAKNNNPNIMAVQADLAHFYLPASHFDVILNFFFLQRPLIPI